jgi:hypothetical protein
MVFRQPFYRQADNALGKRHVLRIFFPGFAGREI